MHGSLFSVNPIATKTRPWIWWKNRRVLTLVETKHAGLMAYMDVGATNCGSIVQTFVPNGWVRKGDEKGYFRLGGSAIILLFEPGYLTLSEDLLKLAESGCEVYCKIGQPLGTAQK
jgi:phosphatidylserine decarboxylase